LLLISDLVFHCQAALSDTDDSKWREHLIAEAARRERIEGLLKGEYAKMQVWVKQKRMLEEEVGWRLKHNAWVAAMYTYRWMQHYQKSYDPVDKPYWWTTAYKDDENEDFVRATQSSDPWCVEATFQRFQFTVDTVNAADTEGSVEERRERKFKRQWKLSKFGLKVATAVAKRRDQLHPVVDHRLSVPYENGNR
jgi:hypothetical protein